MFRAAIFDFDGTLIELTLDFSDLRRHVERLALTYVPRAFIRGLDSLYMLEMIDEVEEKLGGPGAAFRQEAYTILRELEVKAAQGKTVYPYTREVLTVLRGQGREDRRHDEKLRPGREDGLPRYGCICRRHGHAGRRETREAPPRPRQSPSSSFSAASSLPRPSSWATIPPISSRALPRERRR